MSGYANGDFQPLARFEPSWPIYRRATPDFAVFYAPGCLCVVPGRAAAAFEDAIGPDGEGWALRLWTQSVRAVATEAGGAFEPECLMLYLNNECKLRCVYCHSEPSAARRSRLDLSSVGAAARLVAETCARRNRRLHVVFHGGGEPTVDGALLEETWACVQHVAAEAGLDVFRYVATNGVMSAERARWLARHFDLIGLSCDGPAPIHDSQRRGWNGSATSSIVERTADVIHEAGGRLAARTTITRRSLALQVEIVEYLLSRLKPQEIDFEPVYASARAAGMALGPEDVPAFVEGFTQARRTAKARGTPLRTALGCFEWLHGPYCHFQRHVLCVIPGGLATACFRHSDASQALAYGTCIGALDAAGGSFVMDVGRIGELQQRLGQPAPRCLGCFNRYHCCRECPDACPLLEAPGDPGPSFRCSAERRLAATLLEELADGLWRGPAPAADGHGARGTDVDWGVLG